MYEEFYLKQMINDILMPNYHKKLYICCVIKKIVIMSLEDKKIVVSQQRELVDLLLKKAKVSKKSAL